MRTYIFYVEPVAKPRQTRSDVWRKRPEVMRYRAFADELRAQANAAQLKMPAGEYHLIFNLPMPQSWSKTRRAAMLFQPHQQKPDKDNLEKAFLDALLEDDSYVYDGRVSKFWSETGFITLIVGDSNENLKLDS